MVRISVDLLRKRAEHNDGILSTLEELSLHQLDIERIELLGQACRRLRILYLQNNLVPRLENLHKLKELQYLNAALNNVTSLRGLEGCEALAKLDLTLNFVPAAALPDGLAHLRRHNPLLRELHLAGNPCAQWHGYRHYVAAALPQLLRLDGEDIKPSERIVASKRFEALHDELLHQQDQCDDADTAAATGGDGNGGVGTSADDIVACTSGESGGGSGGGEGGGGDGMVRRPWCPETRLQEHREAQRVREEAEQRSREARKGLFGSSGDGGDGGPVHCDPDRPFPEIQDGQAPRQKNEGGWRFTLDDGTGDGGGKGCDGMVVLRVRLGRAVDTSLVRTDVQPSCVRVMVKGRLLQLSLPHEVDPGASTAQRSRATGELVVAMPTRQGDGPRTAPLISVQPRQQQSRGSSTKRSSNGGSGENKCPTRVAALLRCADDVDTELPQLMQ